MKALHRSTSYCLCLTPLAAAFAAVFAITSPEVMAATTWTVSNPYCGDLGNHGSGNQASLRYVSLNAKSGDMVNITCSTISLSGTAVTFAQDDLTLNGSGPGASSVLITQPVQGRVFAHYGSGTLALNKLTLSAGTYLNTNAYGGCVYSAGNVSLDTVDVVSCQAIASGGNAYGGGIFTKGALTLTGSSVSGNYASAGIGGKARGGGVFAQGNFSSSYSTISGNTAMLSSGNGGRGGGLFLGSNATILNSTISNNTSLDWGGVDIYSSSPSSLVTTISNCTISGNHATAFTGGLYVNSGMVTLSNSTIAFNTAANGIVSGKEYAAGMATSARLGPMSVTLQSTLIANNTYGTASVTALDLTTANTSTFSIMFNAAPAHNLVFATSVGVPSDTLQNVCPLLGPLRNNGGSTDTHALQSHSPAIDAGYNPDSLSFDQRGSGYGRVSGSAADIGAYEAQQVDIIFNSGFDGCP